MQFYAFTNYTAVDAPVIHAVALQNNTTGIDVGTGCNKRHVTGPMILIPMKTLPKIANQYGFSGYLYHYVPWQSVFANVKITVQGAWGDSRTKRLNLTQAVELILPSAPPRPLPARQTVWAYNKTSTVGNAGPYPYYYYNPAFAYIFK